MIKAMMLLLSCLLLLSACTPRQEQGTTMNYKQGYGEPHIVFEEASFPEREYQNSQISLAVDVQNDAAYDAESIKLSIVGFEPTYVELSPAEETIDDLEGKNVYTPAGGRETIIFNGQVHSLLNNADFNLQNYRLYLAYSSHVEFSPTVCINPSQHEVYDSSCQLPTGPISFSGQGAPVAVTRMEEIIRPGINNIEFRLAVDNKGQGKMKKLFIRDARLGNNQLSCIFRENEINPQELEITSSTSTTEIVCTGTLESQNSYTTALFVDVGYDYELAVQRSLRIEK